VQPGFLLLSALGLASGYDPTAVEGLPPPKPVYVTLLFLQGDAPGTPTRGTLKPLSQGSMRGVERQPAEFISSGAVLRHGKGRVELFEVGPSVVLTAVLLKNGNVRLDVTLEERQLVVAGGEGRVVVMRSAHVAGIYSDRLPVRLVCPPQDGAPALAVELTVREDR
jgi:hypothetical protein